MGREKEEFEDVQDEGRQHAGTRLRKCHANEVHNAKTPQTFSPQVVHAYCLF